MSASLVEVKNDETFAYYTAYIKDFQRDQLLVHYSEDWKADEWVSPHKVRQAVARHDSSTFHPQVDDEVEAMAKSHEDEPHSWWRAKIRTIRGEFYMINYCDWDDTYNEIVEKELLRPPNRNPPLDARALLKEYLDIPKELHETESEQQDQKVQSAKQNKYAEVQITSGVLSLIEEPAQHRIMLLGSKSAVEKAKMFMRMHFNHMSQLKRLQRRVTLQEKQLEEDRRKLNQGFIEEFHIEPKLSGLVIGKKGKNIKDAEAIHGIISVKVDAERGVVKIVAQTAEAAQEARKMLEYVEEQFPIPSSKVGKIVGPKFAYLLEIEKNSKVMRISVPRREDEKSENTTTNNRNRNNNNNNNNRNNNRNNRDDSSITNILIVGTRETVANAVVMLKGHVEFVNELDREQSKMEIINQQRRELSLTYGLKLGNTYNNNNNGSNNNSNNNDTADVETKNEERPARPRRNNNNNNNSNSNNNSNNNNSKPRSQFRPKAQNNANNGAPAANGDSDAAHTNGAAASAPASAPAQAPASSTTSASTSGDSGSANADAVDVAAGKPPRNNKKRGGNRGRGRAEDGAQGDAEADAAATS